MVLLLVLFRWKSLRRLVQVRCNSCQCIQDAQFEGDKRERKAERKARVFARSNLEAEDTGPELAVLGSDYSRLVRVLLRWNGFAYGDRGWDPYLRYWRSLATPGVMVENLRRGLLLALRFADDLPTLLCNWINA